MVLDGWANDWNNFLLKQSTFSTPMGSPLKGGTG